MLHNRNSGKRLATQYYGISHMSSLCYGALGGWPYLIIHILLCGLSPVPPLPVEDHSIIDGKYVFQTTLPVSSADVVQLMLWY